MKLKHPFDFKGEKITEIRMRRPKVKDTRIANKTAKGDDEQAEINLMANLASVEPDLIDQMDLADYQKLQKEFQSFLS